MHLTRSCWKMWQCILTKKPFANVYRLKVFTEFCKKAAGNPSNGQARKEPIYLSGKVDCRGNTVTSAWIDPVKKVVVCCQHSLGNVVVYQKGSAAWCNSKLPFFHFWLLTVDFDQIGRASKLDFAIWYHMIIRGDVQNKKRDFLGIFPKCRTPPFLLENRVFPKKYCLFCTLGP